MNPDLSTFDFSNADDADIRAAQTELGVDADGDFGPISQKALAEWRAANSPLASDGSALVGDGTWPWQAQIVGDDIVLFGYASCFGGDSDPQDDGETASGISTKTHPTLAACSIPMDGRMFSGLSRLERAALNGCPLPRVPFIKTMVRVAAGGVTQDLEVIDLGPGKQATTSKAEPHVIDLTVAAAKQFDPNATATNFMWKVEATILGGAQYARQSL